MDAERKCTSCMARAASVVASSTLRAGPPGSRRAAIVASVSRRTGAEISWRPAARPRAARVPGLRPEAVPGRGAGLPLLRRRGRRRKACRRARLPPRRSRLRHRPLDDLRQRGDRLRCAGAGVRLACSSRTAARSPRPEARRGPGSSAAAPAASPRASASRAASRSSATAPGSPAGSVCMTCAATWRAGAPALAQDRRRRVVQSLPFGGRQVAVDRRAQDRVGEADGAGGFHDARGHQRRHRRLQVGAAESGQPRGVAHLRAVAERAERAGERGGSRRQPRQAEQHRVGDAAGHDRAEIVRGGRGGIDAASRRLVEQLADEEGVAARHVAARANRSSGSSDSRAAISALTAASVRADGRSSWPRDRQRAPPPRASAQDQAAGWRG